MGDQHDDWIPVDRTEVKVKGINIDHPGLLDVVIQLNQRPPAAWAQMFEAGAGVGIQMSMHPPRLIEDVVAIRPPDEDVESYVTHVDTRIAAANERYEAEELPRLRRESEAAERAAADDRTRVQEAQRRLDSL